jgi:hypothetical protein
MEQLSNEEEQDLKKALGKPKYYLDAPDKIAGERYFWFPNQGDSMNDRSARSVPGGSMVLGRLLAVKNIEAIPLQSPLVFIIDYKGEQFCLLKCPTEINSHAGKLCLHSYNPAPGYDDLWLPFQYIKYIFVVERVRRPDGSEFVP